MEYTRPATWDDVKQLARHLEDAGVEYALVGGYDALDRRPQLGRDASAHHDEGS